MDIKKILWVVFSFVVFGLIAVAVLAIVRAQLTNMGNQVPELPDTSQITSPLQTFEPDGGLQYEL